MPCKHDMSCTMDCIMLHGVDIPAMRIKGTEYRMSFIEHEKRMYMDQLHINRENYREVKVMS
jgi:hypothetical protein